MNQPEAFTTLVENDFIKSREVNQIASSAMQMIRKSPIVVSRRHVESNQRIPIQNRQMTSCSDFLDYVAWRRKNNER